MKSLYLSSLCLLLSISAATEGAAAAEDSEIYAQSGNAVLTQKNVDAVFARVPDDLRLSFIRDASRVETQLRRVFLDLILAEQAVADGFAEDPIVQERMFLAGQTELAKAWLDELVRRARPADYEQMALEHYIVNQEKFLTKATYDVTQLLIRFEDRTEEEALNLAEELHARAVEQPAEFDNLVEQYSEDPSAAGNLGRFTDVSSGQMDPQFERAALDLGTAGDISGPVRTRYGYHLIRLDGRTPPRPQAFAEVRSRLIQTVKKDHEANIRAEAMRRAQEHPMVAQPEAVEKMLKRYFGDELEGAPSFNQ